MSFRTSVTLATQIYPKSRLKIKIWRGLGWIRERTSVAWGARAQVSSNLLVERTLFLNTSGTQPEGGVDLEPDMPTARAPHPSLARSFPKFPVLSIAPAHLRGSGFL